MDEGLKKRLIGATVLVSLVVIFVPMLLEKDPVVTSELEEEIIPEKPVNDFSTKVLPMENEDLSKPPPEPELPAPVAAEKPKPAEPVSVIKPKVATKDTTIKTKSKPKSAEKSKKPETRVGLSQAWVVQVGSFSKRDNAEKLVKVLRTKKYEAFTDQVDIGGRVLHRVLVGPEVDKKRAEKILGDLNKYLKPQKLTGRLKSYP